MPKANKAPVIAWDGLPITKPGIYKGISLELYHSAELFDGVPAVSSSSLRKIFQYSPAHYWAESPYNPDRVDPEDKPHFVLGRALHHLTSGEGGFQQLFVVQPETYEDAKSGEVKKWNGNAGPCILWKAQQARAERTILTPRQVEQLRGMALSLGKDPLVKQGILSGHIEHSYFWRDPETGIWMKWRPDSTPIGSADFVDLKTTTDARWFKLQRTVEDLGYNQQGALGAEACPILLGRPMDSFSLFFIEKERPPYACQLVELDAADIELGRRMNRSALRTFWRCWKAKEWPGPADGDVSKMKLNDKTRERIDTRLHAEGL